MQNKGFVKVFAVLLTLACIFYLSFSFVTRYQMNKAEKDPKGAEHYLDSMQNQKVWLGIYTLKQCREMEIGLGLDLKGGMNVILEVSVSDVVKALGQSSAADFGLRGEVVILQHADNLVSVYSNNSTSLVKTGQSVEAGSPVAIIGSRPGAPDVHYLHFELWHNGDPLDPSEYINY